MSSMHFIAEMIWAFSLLYVASQFYRTYKGEFEAATITLVGSLILCSVSDIFHAVEAYKHAELLKIWVPWSWGISRGVLGTMLIMTSIFALCKPRIKYAYYTIGIAFISSFLLNALPIFNPSFILDLGFVQADGIIKRPMDAALFLMWSLMTALMWRGGEARLVFPRGFRWFMSLGALSHFIMAFFSKDALDGPFMVAHGAKIAEGLVWAYFVHKDLCRSEKVGIDVYKAERVGETIAEHNKINADLAYLVERYRKEK